MAPIRRYLRITKYSVLECRIYLDNPALAETWLLNPRNPILPRVIESIRPYVLPKLREENAKSKAKGGKKKGIKDVVSEEDFEVSIFLTETSTRHSLLTKLKHFRDSDKKLLQSNSAKLTGASNDTAIDVEEEPVILRENSEEPVNLDELPDAADDASVSDSNSLFVDDDDGPALSKRARTTTNSIDGRASKRLRDNSQEGEEEADTKKKAAMDTTYEGFAIYGRVLCLVVKRKNNQAKASVASVGGQATMENWITSTQMPPPDDINDV